MCKRLGFWNDHVTGEGGEPEPVGQKQNATLNGASAVSFECGLACAWTVGGGDGRRTGTTGFRAVTGSGALSGVGEGEGPTVNLQHRLADGRSLWVAARWRAAQRRLHVFRL